MQALLCPVTPTRKVKKITKYSKKHSYSYTLGAYPTIELIERLPKALNTLYIRSNSKSNKGVQKAVNYCRQKNVPVIESNNLIEMLSAKENVYCAGIFDKYTTDFNPNTNHIVLYKPSDMGNLGTIIRTMEGFNLDHLAIIGDSADIFNPHVVRASMGSLFSMKFRLFRNLTEYAESTNNNLYFVTTGGSENLNTISFSKPASLVFGNEAGGLPGIDHLKGERVKIPQSGKIDSLNLAVSVGIVLYQFSK